MAPETAVSVGQRLTAALDRQYGQLFAITSQAPNDPRALWGGTPASGTAGVTIRARSGPAEAAAALAAATGRQGYADQSARIVEWVLSAQPAAQGDSVALMMSTCRLAGAALTCGSMWPATRRASVIAGLGRTAEALVQQGNLTWYANGNLSIGYAALAARMWRLTCDELWRGRWRQAWAFAQNPAATSSQWAGKGLIVQAAGDAFGKDGAGYFVETDPITGTTGFDGDYAASHQSEMLMALLLATRDADVDRVGRQVLGRVLQSLDPGDFTVSVAGSRHPETSPPRRDKLRAPQLVIHGLRGAERATLGDLVARWVDAQIAYTDTSLARVDPYWYWAGTPSVQVLQWLLDDGRLT